MTAPRPATLITGASNGIGRALAERWAAEGQDLLLVARSADRLTALATTLAEQYGVRAETIIADLADPAGAPAVARRVAASGVDVETLINNAGVGLHGAFTDTDLDRERSMIELNVAAVVALTKLLLPGMRARGRGRIVNVASVAAFTPGPYQSIYYASKAFVLSFSEAIGAELAGSGVTVTTVCPGPTVSGFHAAAGVRRQRQGFYDRFLVPAALVADATWHGVQRGKRLVVPGLRHRVLLTAIRLLPRGLALRAGARTSAPRRD